MSELEDKLNSLLSDPAGMAQIMQLAQQLSGSMPASSSPPPESSPPPPPAAPSLGNLDPKLLTRLLPLVQSLSIDQSNSANLLHALRPYLKAEKQAKVERAVRLARLIVVGKKFLADMEG